MLATDPETGETSYKEVLKTYTYVKDTLVYIEANGETIETTREHPFWVEGQGWTKAKFLNEGDLLRDSNGNNITINRVDIVPLPENQYTIVYNLEVADYHTYYVSNEHILVHNVCVEKIADKFTKKGIHKVNYIADDLSKAKNYARKNIVGHNTERITGLPFAKSSNKGWQGWHNLGNGNTVYWNHGDWMTGEDLSRFPHINYSMDGGKTIGHIFLKDKIKKNGMWDEFISEIGSWQK